MSEAEEVSDLWDTKTEEHYVKMRARHPKQWEFVESFISRMRVNSVVEVGCGIKSPVAAMVSRYQGVDINRKTSAIHENFVTLDMDVFKRWFAPFDLLLALNVIEHCLGWSAFLRQVKKLNCPYSLISFFTRLDHEEFVIRKAVTGENYHLCGFVQADIESSLQELGMNNYEFVHLAEHDHILLIGEH